MLGVFMIIEYEEKYLDDVRDLLVELEEYIVSIDKDNLDTIHPEYREKMAILDLEEVKENNGKCYLAIENGKAVGLIMGTVVSYDKYDYLDYKCPKKGEITELIISKKVRSTGIGQQLMKKMEDSLTEQQYLRDANYQTTEFAEADVLAEHEKINSADAIAFIYPVFWTEAPAKLVGWFDRVWTYGFAYGNNKKMKMLEKAMILCSAGNPIEKLEQFGLLASMKKVMFGDRLFNRAKQMEFVVFDGTSREKDSRENNWDSHLEKAYKKGKNFFAEAEEVNPSHAICFRHQCGGI